MIQQISGNLANVLYETCALFYYQINQKEYFFIFTFHNKSVPLILRKTSENFSFYVFE